MSYADALALKAGIRIGETAGPKAGLRALRPILGFAEGSARRDAILTCIGYALESDDRSALAELLPGWGKAGINRDSDPVHSTSNGLAARTDWFARITAIVTRHRAKYPLDIRTLVDYELQRAPHARVYYLRACLRHDGGESSALLAFREALAGAVQAGDTRIQAAAASHMVALAFCNLHERHEAVRDAARILPSLVTLEEKVRIVPALLFSASRFTRTLGLQILVEAAEHGTPQQRSWTLATAARFADARAAQLTELERDRLRALFTRSLSPAAAALALARMQSVAECTQTSHASLDPADPQRTRAVERALGLAPELLPYFLRAKDGLARPHLARSGPYDAVTCAQDLIVALTIGRAEAAEEALARMVALPSNDFAPSATTVVYHALVLALRTNAPALTVRVESLIMRISGSTAARLDGVLGPPKEGYLGLARLFPAGSRGRSECLLLAWAAHEDGANAARVDELIAVAKDAYVCGALDRSSMLLHEAKTMASAG